ncbi:unnamed protein product [Cyprideis torosa]|uniref:Ribosome biogenesis protein BRX1 homolog n=1 Tax=Cyprideis torosa TaxID=163714 RepID=A0A7R8ZL57_9CRUS|nr:unnamed protein product [Cyprideis torosa]CAG0891018.1 unnamed protein product [Cyprideis torosa]
MGKRKRADSATAPDDSSSDESGVELPAVEKNKKWVNRQRVLVFASRGITYLHRHLMEDLRRILPHSKPETKKEKSAALTSINEICEMRNCNKCIYFEGRKKEDLYMWASSVPDGPSMKFLVENIHTLKELKLTGNCLKGSRALLVFNKDFDSSPHLQLMKELFVQLFGTPRYHPKSQPFIDHVLVFTFLDKKVWIRNYQILEEKGALAEIGPRLVLNPIKIFQGSFCGQTIWENPHYISPNLLRRRLKEARSLKYKGRVEQKKGHEARRPETSYPTQPVDDIYS